MFHFIPGIIVPGRRGAAVSSLGPEGSGPPLVPRQLRCRWFKGLSGKPQRPEKPPLLRSLAPGGRGCGDKQWQKGCERLEKPMATLAIRT